MPRGRSMPPPKTSPLYPSKQERMQALTRKIVERLQELRRARGLANSAHRPVLQPGETIRAVHIYSGVSQNVNGPSHRYYDRLGRIFFVVSTGNGPGTIRILWDDVVLPREMLESDLELNQMLQQRWNISRENRRSRSIPVSTPPADTRRRIARLADIAGQVTTSASSPSSAVPPVVPTASATHSRYPRPAVSAGQAAHRSSPSSSDSSAVLPPSPTGFAAHRRVSEWARSVQVLPAAILSALPTASRAPTSSESGHSIGATRASSIQSNGEVQSSPANRNTTTQPGSDDEVEFIRYVPANRTPRQSSDDEVQFIGIRPANGNRTIRPDSDDEVEFIGIRPANRNIQPEHVENNNETTSSSPDPSISITLVAWNVDSHEHTTAKLPLQNGQFMMLSMVPEALRTLQLSNVERLDRYIPGKGWTRILMDTLFRIYDGDVVSLKPSTVQHVNNFEIHASHLYY
ncbi:hypothetical protein F5880DRAFT_1616381 [Lentinula raphanica]|nr:hypothetical protein F5880DRAFT_1616381 [Lentinula raphanica]